MLVNRCDCCGCGCTMCADSSYCADTPTVSITHEGVTTELAPFLYEDGTGFTTLGEITFSVENAVGGLSEGCVPEDEEGVYPFCSFFTASTTYVGPGNRFLYSLLFYFDGSTWKLRVFIGRDGGTGYYKEINLAVSEVNCDDLAISDEIIDRCTGDTGGDPTETITINITR